MMIVRPRISLAAAVALAGCSGAGGSTPYGGSASNVTASAMHSLSGIESSVPDAKSVSVRPDKVDLTLKKPTESVTVKGPKGTTFTEKDDCTSKEVATITLSGTDTYEVTAGAKSGTCTATFSGKDSSGKKVGSAQLKVQNTI